jgi:transposase
MANVSIIGVDLAKQVFKVHGAYSNGSVAFRKKLNRTQFLPFISAQPECVVAMESCATAHGWAREIGKLGHKVKLIPPQYVKPFVKRQKNDRADAEAISEAAVRPSMRFVEVKTVEQQSRAMLFRSRQMFVSQRTQTINALRGHLAEYGVIGPKSKAGLKTLRAVMVDDEDTDIPDIVRASAELYLGHIDALAENIAHFTIQLEAEAKSSKLIKRLTTMPGVGLQTALAIEVFAPDMSCFKKGRDFAAWLGLVPLQKSTGGKSRLGKVSKMGQKDIRSLLIVGAMSVIGAATRFGVKPGSWLARMLDRKSKLLVAITLANKMARGIWAMLIKKEDYLNPEAVA